MKTDWRANLEGSLQRAREVSAEFEADNRVACKFMRNHEPEADNRWLEANAVGFREAAMSSWTAILHHARNAAFAITFAESGQATAADWRKVRHAADLAMDAETAANEVLNIIDRYRASLQLAKPTA